MNGLALLSASYRLLADGGSADAPTDWWRIIGLAAVTVATVAILALLFRPGALGRPEFPEPGDAAPEPDRSGRPPGLYPLPSRPVDDPAMDSSRAAERLRQIVGQSAAAEAARRRGSDRRANKPENGTTRDDASSDGAPGQRDTKDEGASMESGNQVATTVGGPEREAQTADQLQKQIDRYFHRADRPTNVVQFTPRKPAPTTDGDRLPPQEPRTPGRAVGHSRTISQFPIDTATRDGINATIQELLFCANVGELLHGFALYTDRFLFQFMDDSRMSEDEFRQAYSDIPAKDPSEWIRIDSISSFERLPDGRITVRVRYIDGAEINGAEQLTMKFDSHYERWLIDNIEAI